jgi:hypothetical protein
MNVWCNRLAVGVSENGNMVGPQGKASNAVICSPANNNSLAEYRIMSESFSGPCTCLRVCVREDALILCAYAKVCVCTSPFLLCGSGRPGPMRAVR